MSDFSPRRILLVKPSSMGDVIHALPVAAALHQKFPDAEIRWVIHPSWKELLDGNPAIAQTILFPREHFRGISGLVRSVFWAKTLRAWKPDLAIDLQGLLRSALIAHAAGSARIIGLSDAREGASFFYSSLAKVNPMAHAVTRYLKILDLLEMAPQAPEFRLPEGTLPKDFSISTPFVVIHPYARGEGKNLTQEQVCAFAETLGDVPVVLVGKGDRMESLPANVIDWSGRTTLLDLIGILRHAAFIVSSDSGPMHLAVALQPARTLAIHRWSDPLRVGPYSKESLIWKEGNIVHRDQLTAAWRAPGRTPTLEEMRAIGKKVGLALF